MSVVVFSRPVRGMNALDVSESRRMAAIRNIKFAIFQSDKSGCNVPIVVQSVEPEACNLGQEDDTKK